jgi:hypothetical protein
MKDQLTNNDLQNTTQISKLRTVWRHQRGNQNQYIEEEETDRASRISVITGDDRMCSGMVSSSSSTSGTHRDALGANPVICHAWGKDWIVITTKGTYPWSFMTQSGRNNYRIEKELIPKARQTFLSFILHKKLISIITEFRKSYFLGSFSLGTPVSSTSEALTLNPSGFGK